MVKVAAYDDSPKGMGGTIFAASMMLMIGVFQGITGLVAIFNDEWYVKSANYTFDLDITAYGWIHLILGIIIFLAGLGLFAGQVWAAMVAIFLAILIAIDNFFFIPYYPFWSILIIALCVWVVWALTRPGTVRTT